MKKMFPRIVLACALAALAFICLPVLAAMKSGGDKSAAAFLLPQAARSSVLRMFGAEESSKGENAEAASVQGNPGDLDVTFSGDGKNTTAFGQCR